MNPDQKPATSPEIITNSLATIKVGVTHSFLVLQISRMWKCDNPAHDVHQSQEQVSIRREELEQVFQKLTAAKQLPVPAADANPIAQTGPKNRQRNLPPEVMKVIQEKLNQVGNGSVIVPVTISPPVSPGRELPPSAPLAKP